MANSRGRSAQFRDLACNEGLYQISDEKLSVTTLSHSRGTNSAVDYRTVLVGRADGKQHLGHMRLPKTRLFAKLFCVQLSPLESKKRMVRHALQPERFLDGEWLLDTTRQTAAQHQRRYTRAVHQAVVDLLVPDWSQMRNDSNAGACSLYSHQQDAAYNALSVLLFHRAMTYYAPDYTLPTTPYPRALPRVLHDFAAELVRDAVQDLEARYLLLYFCPQLVNDLFYHVPHWHQLVARLLRQDWMKLVTLTALFWSDPVRFCFDDTLSAALVPLKLPVVVQRTAPRIERAAADDKDQCADEVDGDDGPESFSDQDAFVDATEEVERESAAEHQRRFWPQGDDTERLNLRIMSANDLDALCSANVDACERFVTLRTPFSRAVAVQTARIHQIVVNQLSEVGNVYCTDDMLATVHRLEGRDSKWRGQREVCEHAIQSLIDSELLIHLDTGGRRALALPVAVQQEARVFARFNELFEAERTAPEEHPFYQLFKQEERWRAKAALYEVTEEQQRAIEVFLSRRILMLNGPGGSGKTFTLTRCFSVLTDCSQSFTFRVATPTCRSRGSVRSELIQCGVAINADTVCTAQYFIALAQGELRELRKKRPTATLADVRRRVNVLALDEISMWSTQLFYKLMQVFDFDMLVLIGDLEQCLPIGWGRPFHVLGDFEQLRNERRHLVTLTKIHRNTGDIRAFGTAVVQNDATKLYGPGIGELPRYTNRATLSSMLQLESHVVAIDGASQIGAGPQWLNSVAELNLRMQQLEPPGRLPSLNFVTYSVRECEEINALVCRQSRATSLANRCAMMPRPPDPLPVTTEEQPALRVGDYVTLSANMKNVHRVFTNATPGFLQLWFTKYGGSAAPLFDRLQEARMPADDAVTVSNGDTGLVVQMYLFNPRAVCPHAQHRSITKGQVSACERCMQRNPSLLSGNGFEMSALVADATDGQLRSWQLAAKNGPWLVVVLWSDLTNELIHLPLPIYKRQKIQPGFAVTFYRAQGSQWRNVAFVCSNGRRAQGDSSRTPYQKKMDRQRTRGRIGDYQVTPPWSNRRTFYVGVTRSRLRLFLLFSIDRRDKIRQLMEHDPAPPSILEDLLAGELKLDERTRRICSLASDNDEEDISDADLQQALAEWEQSEGRGEKRSADDLDEEQEDEACVNPAKRTSACALMQDEQSPPGTPMQQ